MASTDGLDYWDMTAGPMPFAEFIDFVMSQPGYAFTFSVKEHGGERALRLQVDKIDNGRIVAVESVHYRGSAFGPAAGDNGAFVWSRLLLLWELIRTRLEQEGAGDGEL